MKTLTVYTNGVWLYWLRYVPFLSLGSFFAYKGVVFFEEHVLEYWVAFAVVMLLQIFIDPFTGDKHTIQADKKTLKLLDIK